MKRAAAVIAIASIALLGCATRMPPPPSQADARNQVFAVERAFAKTMADRDHAAFATFISEETVFYSGPVPLHGKQKVVDFWAKFYSKAEAPFSWEPDTVEAVTSGTLALSSGPVRDPSGKVFARFTSIWRWEPPGQWRIVFDKGNEVCDCAKP
jgi:ketosteroid isomerase-like protein